MTAFGFVGSIRFCFCFLNVFVLCVSEMFFVFYLEKGFSYGILFVSVLSLLLSFFSDVSSETGQV